MRYIATLLLILSSFLGCSGLVIDPSPNAVASNDLTLALKACDGPIYSGFGVCRVKEATKIESYIHVILPKVSGPVLGGELIFRIKDIVKSYSIPDNGIIVIPMTDIYGERAWEIKDTAIANATAKMRVKFNEGLEGIVQAEGQVLVRVLANGYDPLPIDSGYSAWGRECKVDYSSAGRGAVVCK